MQHKQNCDNSHLVLSIPPSHFKLNAVEKIWAILKKKWAATKNVSFNTLDVEKLVEE